MSVGWSLCSKCEKIQMLNPSEWMVANGHICTCGGTTTTALTTVSAPVKTQKESIEDILHNQLTEAGIDHERQYRFDPKRRWRSDVFIKPNWLVECHGLLYQGGGGHGTYDGIEKDAIKQNQAVIQGFRPLIVTGRQIRSGEALRVIQEALGPKEKEDA